MPADLTNGQAEALGRRWREAKGDMERPGMRWIDTTGTLSPVRVVVAEEGVRITTTTHRLYRPARDALDVPTWPDWVPDLRDAATRGAALEVVRERWGEPSLSMVPVDESVPLQWGWTDGGLAAPGMGQAWRHSVYASEPEALVAALEAAPPVKP